MNETGSALEIPRQMTSRVHPRGSGTDVPRTAVSALPIHTFQLVLLLSLLLLLTVYTC